MGLLSSKILRKQLNPGDHIYTWSRGYLYSHHGIYVGHGKVIHLTRGPGFIISSSSPSQPSKDPVVCCNIKDFVCNGHNRRLYRFEYGVTKILFVIKRSGTCSLVRSSQPNVVLHRASSLLENGFGNYNLLGKNCEDFALYCKTGSIKGDGYLIGRSGQINSLAAASLAVTIIPIQLLNISLIGVALVIGGFYSFFRLGYEVEFEEKHGCEKFLEVEFEEKHGIVKNRVDIWKKKKKKKKKEEEEKEKEKEKEMIRRWSFKVCFCYAVFAFIIWYWFPERKTLQSFIFYHFLFGVVTDQLRFHGFELEEYGFYAVWLLGYWYWRSVTALLLWVRFLCFFRFYKNFLPDGSPTSMTILFLFWDLGLC